MKLGELIEILDKPLLIRLSVMDLDPKSDNVASIVNNCAYCDSFGAVVTHSDDPQYYEAFEKIVDHFKDANVVSLHPGSGYAASTEKIASLPYKCHNHLSFDDDKRAKDTERTVLLLDIEIDAPMDELADLINNSRVPISGTVCKSTTRDKWSKWVHGSKEEDV